MLSLCRKCKKLISIDIYGNIECEKGLVGKERIVCKHFEEKFFDETTKN